MKIISLFVRAALCGSAILCGTGLFAENSAPQIGLPPVSEMASKTSTENAPPIFNWSLLWSGSWEEKTFTLDDDPALAGNLLNRGEIKLHFLPPALVLRTQILDRSSLNINIDEFQWEDLENPEKEVTNFTAGLYHKTTGSRLLFGVLDEWGLPARIRNPWIRSPPYAENHSPIITDLRTAVSTTKEDEAYLYLSSPFLEFSPNLKLRGFISAQTEVENFIPAIAGGLDFTFPKKTSLLLETFYTGRTLPQTKASTWFSDPPRLVERDFRLYAAALLFANPNFSLSSDFAVSETFSVGRDIYANLGVAISPSLPFGAKERPLLVSFSADGAGARFVYRDGANHGEGFRSAAKIEWKGRYSSLIRLNTVLRSPGFGNEFNRSSSGFYWRFPSSSAIRNNSSVYLTRISLSMDRNAVNPLKINDSFSGSLGITLNLPKFGVRSPLNINLSGSVKGLTGANMNPSPFPVIDEAWKWDSSTVNCELYLPVSNLQFRFKAGISFFEGKEEVWDFSLSSAVRFRLGRLSFKVASPAFPEKWNWTISWRLERKER
ncbi:MAG: hypothetical protein LBI28_02440 [Treponema sp.]|jgi:hypothetical protein|nr:hypothetical protein [Treponema sp.]